MGEYKEAFEWDADSESQLKGSSSVSSVLGSVFGLNRSNSDDCLGAVYLSTSLPPSAECHYHLLPHHSHTDKQTTVLTSTAAETPPPLRLIASSTQPLSSDSSSSAQLCPHSAPTAATSIRHSTSRSLVTASHHKYYFRKLPRAYRSPTPRFTAATSSVNHLDCSATSIDSIASAILSPSHLYSVPTNTTSTRSAMSDSRKSKVGTRRLLGTFKPRSMGLGEVGGIIPAMSSGPISDEVSVHTPTHGFTTLVCENVAVKPQSRPVDGLALPSTPSTPTTCESTPTSSNKTNKRTARYSFQLHKRQNSSIEAQSPKEGWPSTKSSLSRRRDKSRGEEYIVKKETVFQSGDIWDEEGDIVKTMTMLPRWKAAFGRSRGKSIEGQGEGPSSPIRRNGLASRSQPDLTKLQKLFRDDSAAERMNMPTPYSSLGYAALTSSGPLESPLLKTTKSATGSHFYINSFDSAGQSQPRCQAASYYDNLPSSPRQSTTKASHPSSDHNTAHQSDGTSLQPRQKRNRLLRRPGTTQGTYTAPSTPTVRARPGTSGESSSRVLFHPASDPVISKRFPQRPKTSSGAFQSGQPNQTTPERGMGPETGWHRGGMVCEISLKAVEKPEKIRVEKKVVASGSCRSPLLQVLEVERRPRAVIPSQSISSPLFYTLKEETQPSYNHQPFLLSPAQIYEPPPKRVSSNVKVRELRKTMKALEEAMAISTEERQDTSQHDTPGSSVSRFTEAVSSAGPATPSTNQSEDSAAEEDKRERKSGSSGEDVGDQTVIPDLVPGEDDAVKGARVSQQKSIFDLYCQDHPVNPGLLSPAIQTSARSSRSADSRSTILCSTDSTASFSMDAEFWLVQAAEKKMITARTARSARSATVSTGGDKKNSARDVEVEEIHADDGPGSRPASPHRDRRMKHMQSKGVNIEEEQEPHSLRIEVKWELNEHRIEEEEIESRVVLLSSADIDAIGRAWFRGKASRLSLLSLSSVQEGESVRKAELHFTEPQWDDERKALEQRQEEILRTSNDNGGIFRVHSAPAYVRRSPGHSKTQTPGNTRRWQRKALVLTPRIVPDQSTPIEEPLKSDGSTRRFLVSPQSTVSSSRPSSPNTEACHSKVRISRSPIGPAPLAYKRSTSSFTVETECSRSLPSV